MMMHLTETGTPGYFQVTAEGDGFKVIGIQVHQNDSVQVEELIDNLAEMLAKAIAFDKYADTADRVLDKHGLIQDKG